MSDFVPPGGDQGAAPGSGPPPFGPLPGPPPPAAPYPSTPYPSAPYPSSAYAPSSGTGMAGRSPFSSLQGLTKALTVLWVVVALASVAAMIALIDRANQVDDVLNGRRSPFGLADADDRVGARTGVWLLVGLATLIVFIIWQYRHARNAEQLRGPLGLGPAWAIAGWFVPLAFFVLPGLQVAQAAEASDPSLAPNQSRREGRLPALVPCWAATLSAGFALFIASRVKRPSDSSPVGSFVQRASDFAGADRLLAVGMALFAAAAVFGILMVRALSARQRQAIERAIATMPPPSAMPPPTMPPPMMPRPPRSF